MAVTEAEFHRLAQERYARALENACLRADAEDTQELAHWRATREAEFQQHLDANPPLDFWAWLFDLAPCEVAMHKAS
ncbi:MAG: hypothetical protein CFE31_01860 [Rhizobiales bacterium PAR1]|nr:MAG: hypothetical protein CFE31_01860 [Rhizobiales bacterium PAR1]